ncbi:ABC transporter substrate-binding protein [Arthrobacter sp. ISL-72]|uniref:ABC transporter substrate-binding protein n=1 Tax=Arthrobacter sp. ISL-72 TaxID=2819114 RepID=UPI001BE5362C|nr:ABC transporter substrate-binding protein [Arthrobacter sp. ISL-72]MBT2597862.1 ABC transporter substrate-binding protein [Arthrobacter sp. ISL-72]
MFKNTRILPARNRFLVRTAGAVMGITALLGVAACGGNSSASTSNGTAEVSVGHAAGISNAPLYIGIEKGYFKEEGLNVKLVAFKSGGDMVAPLASGALDAGTAAPGAGIFNAVGRGLGVRLVADTGKLVPGSKYSSLLVRKSLVDSKEFTSVKDLKGKRLGLYADGTSTTLWFDRALKEGGLARADIQANFLSGPDQAVALENGSIDAATTAEPFATKAIENGSAVRFAVGADFYPGLQLGAMMYGTAFTEKNPAAALSFMKGWLRSVKDYNAALVDGQLAGTNAQEVIDIIAKYTELDPKLVAKAYSPEISPTGEMNLAGVAEDLETYRAQGLIEKADLKVEDIMDTSFSEKAAAEMAAK